MTGQEIFRQALLLLNYTNAHGAVDAQNNAELHRRALPIVNQIYADLWAVRHEGDFVPLASLSEPVLLEANTVMNGMIYGVAMLVAQTDGDAENQTLYAALYNQRRSAACTHTSRIQNRMPRIAGE